MLGRVGINLDGERPVDEVKHFLFFHELHEFGPDGVEVVDFYLRKSIKGGSQLDCDDEAVGLLGEGPYELPMKVEEAQCRSEIFERFWDRHFRNTLHQSLARGDALATDVVA